MKWIIIGIVLVALSSVYGYVDYSTCEAERQAKTNLITDRTISVSDTFHLRVLSKYELAISCLGPNVGCLLNKYDITDESQKFQWVNYQSSRLNLYNPYKGLYLEFDTLSGYLIGVPSLNETYDQTLDFFVSDKLGGSVVSENIYLSTPNDILKAQTPIKLTTDVNKALAFGDSKCGCNNLDDVYPCENRNECLLNQHTCLNLEGIGQDCVDTLDGFECICSVGKSFDEDTGRSKRNEFDLASDFFYTNGGKVTVLRGKEINLDLNPKEERNFCSTGRAQALNLNSLASSSSGAFYTSQIPGPNGVINKNNILKDFNGDGIGDLAFTRTSSADESVDRIYVIFGPLDTTIPDNIDVNNLNWDGIDGYQIDLFSFYGGAQLLFEDLMSFQVGFFDSDNILDWIVCIGYQPFPSSKCGIMMGTATPTGTINFQNNLASSFQSANHYFLGAFGTVIKDLNNDGRDDILFLASDMTDDGSCSTCGGCNIPACFKATSIGQAVFSPITWPSQYNLDTHPLTPADGFRINTGSYSWLACGIRATGNFDEDQCKLFFAYKSQYNPY